MLFARKFIAFALTSVAVSAPALAQPAIDLPRQVTPWAPIGPVTLPRPPLGPLAPLSITSWTAIGPAPLATSSPASVKFNVSGRIAGIAAHPTDANTIYVAPAGGGVWKTTDGGTTWTPLTDAQKTVSMGAIAIAKTNPLVVYAGTGEANNSGDSNFGRGILVSSDGGTTWNLATGPSIAFDRLTTSQIAVDPTNASIAYAAMADFGQNGLCCANTGIWKTIDGGTTWANTTTAIDTGRPWSAVAVDPTTPTTLYAAQGEYDGFATNGVYKSTNSGATWTLLSGAPSGTISGRIAISVAPSNSQVLYVTSSSPSTFGLFKIMRSDNGGTTFTDLTAGTPNYMAGQGWYDTAVIVDPSNSATVYVTGASGSNSMLRSTNSGGTWTDISTGGAPNFTSPHVDHHALTFTAGGLLLDGDDGGIYRLDVPTTKSWTDLNGNIQSIQFTGIGLHPTNANLVVGGSQDNGTEVYTGTPVWTETDGGDGGFAKFSSTSGTRVYHQIPVQSFGTNFFRRSDDTGNTWVTKTSSISVDTTQNFYAPFAVSPVNGDRVLYGTTRVWETTTGGDAWTAISAVGSNGFNSGGSNVNSVAIAASDVNTIYATTGSGKIFVTTNHGIAWTEHDLPVGGRVNEIQVDPTNAQIAYAVINAFSASGHVFRTVNGGASWINISGTLPNEPFWSIQINTTTSPSTLYLGADDGVFFSADLGATWNRLGTGLPNAQVVQLDLNTSLRILGAATHGRGAWEIGIPAAPPSATSVTPNSGTGASQVFSFAFTDNAGATDIATTYMVVNSTLSASNGCLVVLNRTSNQLYLYNDAGTGVVAGTVTPGGAGSLSNSQCTLTSGGTVGTAGNILTVPIALTFQTGAFAGLHNIYGYASNNAGQSAGWSTLGSWTPAASTPPTVISVTPVNGSGSPQTFNAVYGDTSGVNDLSAVYLLFNSTLSPSAGCLVLFVPPSNAMYLYNDAGTGVTGPINPGTPGTLSNSQCTIGNAGAATAVAGKLTLPVAITFAVGFTGSKTVFAYAASGGGSASGWQTMGTWNPVAQPVRVVSVSPLNGSGSPQTFTATYGDSVGANDLNSVYLFFNGTFSAANGCVVLYVFSTNSMYLYNDAGTGLAAGAINPGTAGTLSNTQCTIGNAGTTTSAGNNLSLPVAITFAPGFAGSKSVFAYASSNGGGASGWDTVGTWITH